MYASSRDIAREWKRVPRQSRVTVAQVVAKLDADLKSGAINANRHAFLVKRAARRFQR